jgi:hypothetical protein
VSTATTISTMFFVVLILMIGAAISYVELERSNKRK